MNIKNRYLIELFSKVVLFEDKLMYFIIKFIVLKMIIDNINCILDFIVYFFEFVK